MKRRSSLWPWEKNSWELLGCRSIYTLHWFANRPLIFNYDIELRSYKCFCNIKTPSDFVVSAKVMPLSSKFYCSCSVTLWVSANVLLRYIPSTLNIYFLIYQALRSVQRFIIRDFTFSRGDSCCFPRFLLNIVIVLVKDTWMHWNWEQLKPQTMECYFVVSFEYQLYFRQLLEERSLPNRQIYCVRWKSYKRSPDWLVVFAARVINIIHKRSVVSLEMKLT